MGKKVEANKDGEEKKRYSTLDSNKSNTPAISLSFCFECFSAV